MREINNGKRDNLFKGPNLKTKLKNEKNKQKWAKMKVARFYY